MGAKEDEVLMMKRKISYEYERGVMDEDDNEG